VFLISPGSAGILPALPAYVHISRLCGSAAQLRNEHKVILGRAAPSQTLPGAGAWVRGPPARIRKGITGFSWEGKALPDPPAGGGMGKPGFPIPPLERQSVATKVTALSQALPRWGREPGSSPQRGEAGRGAERCERCSPQPSMRLAPHPDGMNILSREGCALPNPPAGGGRGETRFPHPPA